MMKNGLPTFFFVFSLTSYLTRQPDAVFSGIILGTVVLVLKGWKVRKRPTLPENSFSGIKDNPTIAKLEMSKGA